MDPHDKKLIESVMEFKDRIAREVMVPRVDIFSLPHDTTIEEAAKLIYKEGYSRTPVYKDTLDNLTARGYKAELFYEPDVDRIIAIGTHPIPSHKRDEWIRSHELLTF